MNLLRETIRWVWVVVCMADFFASGLAWLEMRSRRAQSFRYMGSIQSADALRSMATAVGLLLFGINVQTKIWYVLLGCGIAVRQGWSTTRWLLYVRNLINGEGLGPFLYRMFTTKHKKESAMAEENEKQDIHDTEEPEGKPSPQPAGATVGGPGDKPPQDPPPDPPVEGN